MNDELTHRGEPHDDIVQDGQPLATEDSRLEWNLSRLRDGSANLRDHDGTIWLCSKYNVETDEYVLQRSDEPTQLQTITGSSIKSSPQFNSGKAQFTQMQVPLGE